MKKISGVKAALAMLLLAGLLATFAGCGGGSALVGKWDALEDGKPSGEIMEFLKDGTFTADGMEGEWKAEKGRITFTFPSFFGYTLEYDYKISGSTLTLTDDDGEVEIYQKVKK